MTIHFKNIVKIIKKAYYYFSNMPTEDISKTASKVAELNREGPPGWIALEGFNAVTRLDFLPTGGVIFNPTSGFPMKVFVNQISGEIKMFSAFQFLKNA